MKAYGHNIILYSLSNQFNEDMAKTYFTSFVTNLTFRVWNASIQALPRTTAEYGTLKLTSVGNLSHRIGNAGPLDLASDSFRWNPPTIQGKQLCVNCSEITPACFPLQKRKFCHHFILVRVKQLLPDPELTLCKQNKQINTGKKLLLCASLVRLECDQPA